MAIELESSAATDDKPERAALKLPRLGESSKIQAKDRRFFTEQLALLLSTGTNLHTSLLSLREQAATPAMHKLIDGLIQDVGEGKQFSRALAEHPEVFSRTYTNLIAASEGGGYMHEVLEQLLEMEEKREKLHRTLFSALSYPIFLLVFALAVVVFVLVVVFPKFADLFASIADQLPATTHFLMRTSELFLNQWPAILVGIALTYFGTRFWAGTAPGRRRLDWAKLNLPPLRNIFTRLYLLQSLRVLGLSLGHGVGIIDALHATRDVVNNAQFQDFLDGVEKNVEAGEGIATGFEDVAFIPPVVAQMIKTGEETGKLPQVMERLSAHYERELSARLDTLSRLAEPVMLLVMGGVVGLIVSSLILPIFKLSRAVG